MRIEKVEAGGGTIDRVLDDEDHKVAEFYRPGAAERFLVSVSHTKAMVEALVACERMRKIVCNNLCRYDGNPDTHHPPCTQTTALITRLEQESLHQSIQADSVLNTGGK